jgi:hypothetical protein
LGNLWLVSERRGFHPHVLGTPNWNQKFRAHSKFGRPGSPGDHQTRMSSARNLSVSRESFEVTVSGGSTFARMKLKEIDGMAPQGVERAV